MKLGPTTPTTASLAHGVLPAAPQVWNWLAMLDGSSAQVSSDSHHPPPQPQGGELEGRRGRGEPPPLQQQSPDMRIKPWLPLPTPGPGSPAGGEGEDGKPRPLTLGTSGRPRGLRRRFISPETISCKSTCIFSRGGRRKSSRSGSFNGKRKVENVLPGRRYENGQIRLSCSRVGAAVS